ncbi:MerR family transcriptional regulator [Jeotgalibacillus haloalkalitolerans]|uniref:MerR family transcriptional regulator n=1 Tax=Jeotgalibacillus haloalkalitolerans TaxID=3104292 RepID=A0ABU5KLL5_9BACL|nr:B12-binding domain-containing protein [Jeotgalibacillus sp. HH7-29]MDZ5712034.1 MerR family transcriptional regulator [Jeotgalibacillus sp. HH7-29]
MKADEGKYNIKAVSHMLGIQPGTLRAWERRYQMIAPVRNESGHRLYTDEHIRKLKWLVSKVNAGFTISQAVALSEQEHEQFVSGDQNENQLTVLREDLLNALMKFDESKAHDLINEAFSLYTVDKVLVDILGSILIKIGLLWEEGRITTAHEHFATSILRSRIGILMHSFPQNNFLPKVVAVCSPGEWHELGLLIFTLYIRRKGFNVIYLGSSIKEGDIQTVLDTVEPKFLFMSCTLKANLSRAKDLIKELQAEYKDLAIGLGGHAVNMMSEEERKGFEKNLVGLNKEDWEDWISKSLNMSAN